MRSRGTQLAAACALALAPAACPAEQPIYDDDIGVPHQAMAEPKTGFRNCRGNYRGRPQRQEAARPLPFFDQP